MSEAAKGLLQVVNYTKQNWSLVDIVSSNMILWSSSLPKTILAGSFQDIPIEFKWEIFTPLETVWGKATYKIDNTDFTFTLHATGQQNSCDMYINWNNTPITTTSLAEWILNPDKDPVVLPENTKESLRWQKRAHSYSFVHLFESHVPNFYGKNVRLDDSTPFDGSNWMTTYYQYLKDTPLNQLILPGAKDAGCSELNWKSKYGVCKTTHQAQHYDIHELLRRGARFLDVRPCLHDGKWVLSRYYKNSESDAYGGDGITLERFVTQLNQFTRANNELVIVYINDPTLISKNSAKFYDFEQPHYDALFYQLREIDHLYIHKDDNVSNLSNLHLGHFITEPVPGEEGYKFKSSVLILVEPPVNKSNKPSTPLKVPSNSGIYLTSESYPMQKQRLLQNNPKNVIQHQFSLLARVPLPIPDSPLNQSMVMNLSLYQSTKDAFWAGLGASSRGLSLLSRGDSLLALIKDHFSAIASCRDRYPSIIMIDAYNTDLAKVCVGTSLIQNMKRYQKWDEQSSRPLSQDGLTALVTSTIHNDDVCDGNVEIAQQQGINIHVNDDYFNKNEANMSQDSHANNSSVDVSVNTPSYVEPVPVQKVEDSDEEESEEPDHEEQEEQEEQDQEGNEKVKGEDIAEIEVEDEIQDEVEVQQQTEVDEVASREGQEEQEENDQDEEEYL
jgi:hypothetical protein